jgi:hypothetical protein
LPIDLEHDVVDEVYDSWHTFFSVTRELVKSIPVSKVSSASTQAIINLSIDVLNEGLRPHLTKWQARFRRWYEREAKSDASLSISPQEIQQQFPQFSDLSSELMRVNRGLMAYRAKLREMVYGP